ncbi:MAG: sulfatase-like hydrolase/transferase [Lunatimonas sp.]|uniref:sulfatase-like hydrolase/transferase n=1 Tax=Lunatimonas sp. TaxID=2060141 RepID=UPI00263AD189|nr:sulfatase-like hydrolase/transferase [Lunatimonas sp.]MCC5937130.1 sulfatase-like hydrolase/transferase [Lunatimonas sp.]
MNRYQFLLLMVAHLFFSCSEREERVNPPSRPHIVFLLADDLGYGELGSYGQKLIHTPVLDELARKGIRFTNFYAGSPICGPSRAVILTGKHSASSTIRGNIGYHPEREVFARVALKPDEMTLGEMLREAGYQTAFIGKWHLDDCNVETWAHHRGFDFAVQEQFGTCPGGIVYDERMHWINGKQDSIFYDQTAYDCLDEFRTEIALDYLDGLDLADPIFLFMSYRAPHAHEKTVGDKDLYADQGWPEIERTHAAKITLLDKQVGRLLDKLTEMGVLDNTLIVFTSDNGAQGEQGHDHTFFQSTGELRGRKRDTYEGGLRVPALAFWAGNTKPGTVDDTPLSGQDFMPTFAEVAGIKVPDQTNGVSFAPVLFGRDPKPRDYLVWEFNMYGKPSTNFRQAVRIGTMKGVRYGVDSSMELYDLAQDISESSDISDQYPELVRKMEDIVQKEHVPNPHFPYGGYSAILGAE